MLQMNHSTNLLSSMNNKTIIYFYNVIFLRKYTFLHTDLYFLNIKIIILRCRKQLIKRFRRKDNGIVRRIK